MSRGVAADSAPSIGRGTRWNVVLLALEWTLLLAGVGVLTITKVYRPYVAVGLDVLLPASFLARYARTGRIIPRTGMEVPWGLFVVGAYAGLWAAYDRPLALLLSARILAAVVVYYALVKSSERVLWWAAIGFVLMAAVLALYWPTQHDFAAEPGKLAMITTIGRWVNAHVPRLPGPSVHANVAGSTLALALPFPLALATSFWRRRRKGIALIWILLTLVLASGLFLTSSRGGWLGVAAVGCLSGLAWVQRRWFRTARRAALLWGAAVAAVLIAGLAVVGAGGVGRLVGMIPDPTGSVQGRTDLFAQGLGLIRDYAFTGSGLGAFSMVHATYAILIPVPFLTHVHNTYLQVWIEQGVLGAAALAWAGAVLVGWAWRGLRGKGVPPLGWAGLAGLAVMAVHGLFDAALYGTRMMPLVGLVSGFAWLTVKETDPAAASQRSGLRRALVIALAVLLLSIALILHRPLLSSWQANLGAVAQTRTELLAYDPDLFADPSMDQLRQAADMSLAEQRFERALAWEDGNPTARQRLGAIALSRGAYEQALAHVQSAWDAGHRDDVTRLLLGDALAATGEIDSAVEMVQGLTRAEERLMFHAWYRYWINGDFRRAIDAWQAVLVLNPDNRDAGYWQAQAEARLNAR